MSDEHTQPPAPHGFVFGGCTFLAEGSPLVTDWVKANSVPVYLAVAPTPSTHVQGWLYDNEDTGREYLDDHPIDSGCVPDATNIVQATTEILLAELKSSWKAWGEDRAELAKLRQRWSPIFDLRKFVDLIDGRAMACDGPVTPFLDELSQASNVEQQRFISILKELYQAGATDE